MNYAWLIWANLFTGLVYLVTQSAIGFVIRVPIARRGVWLRMFVYCAACVGAWVNLGLALTGFWPLAAYVGSWWIAMPAALVAGSACGFLWGGVQDAMLGEHAHAWNIEKGLYEEPSQHVEEAGPGAGSD